MARLTPGTFFRRCGIAGFTLALLGLAYLGLELYALRCLRTAEPPPGRYGLTGLHCPPTAMPMGQQPIQTELDPFMLYRMVPNQELGYCRINQQGFRGGDWGQKQPGRIRVQLSALLRRDIAPRSSGGLKNGFRQMHQLQDLPMQIVKFWFKYLY